MRILQELNILQFPNCQCFFFMSIEQKEASNCPYLLKDYLLIQDIPMPYKNIKSYVEGWWSPILTKVTSNHIHLNFYTDYLLPQIYTHLA